MKNKSAIFVVPKHRVGSHAATITNRGFFVAKFIAFQITAIAGLLYSVIGSQSGWPSRVLGRNFKGSAIFVSAQNGHHISFNALTPKQMRQTSIVLDEIRELTATPSNYVETKKLLSEVFLTYFIAQPYVEAHERYRADATFLAVLLNDLLDELFLQNINNPTLQKPCQN